MRTATTATTTNSREETAPRLVRFDDIAPQPWRNGGGRTRELLAWPDSTDWAVRVSVADVEGDGPFSAFERVQRWFAVLEGEGVDLIIDGRANRLVRGSAPLTFSGESATACRLIDGPTRDLNLMLRGLPGRMHVVAGRAAWKPAHRHCGIFSAVAGRCSVDGDAIAVPARSLLWFDRAPARVFFEAAMPSAAGVAWWLQAGDEIDPA